MMKMQNLTLITGNLGKVAEFERLLGFEFDHQKIDLPEIQTTDVREVVRAKAQLAYEKLGSPVLVDDAGLVIKAWGELPGALIKWFIDNVGNDGIIGMLGNSSRAAYVITALGYCDENGAKIFTGITEGKIADTPRGENGYGYDAIFVPTGQTKTFAEMTSKEKDKISMRAKAVKQLKLALKQK
jgi:XTP/dITP diphosphohydrolase